MLKTKDGRPLAVEELTWKDLATTIELTNSELATTIRLLENDLDCLFYKTSCQARFKNGPLLNSIFQYSPT